MEKAFDGIVDGKHIEVWTPTEEDKVRARKHREEQLAKKSKEKVNTIFVSDLA